MANRKIGESQAIHFFSTCFQDEVRNQLGTSEVYSFGNFSGSQDRVFADVFAGTKSRCVLIEFKEYRKEIDDELRKKLRKLLCKNLDATTADLSRKTHFVAYFKNEKKDEVVLEPYIDTVCPLFGMGIPPLQAATDYGHDSFIDDFISNGRGVSHNDFQRYIGIMSALAKRTVDGKNAAFSSLLYSRNEANGRVKATRFDSLGELETLLQMHPTLTTTAGKTPGTPKRPRI